MDSTYTNPAAAPAGDRSRYVWQGHLEHQTTTVWYTRVDGHQRYVGTCTPIPGYVDTWLAVGLSDLEPSRTFLDPWDGLAWLTEQHQAIVEEEGE